jgi:predicted transcriptional regulator
MANTARMGEIQTHCLRALRRHGNWIPGSGWEWNNYSSTVRIMEGLRRRELVKNTGGEPGSRKEHYVLTEDGKKYLDLIDTPKVPREHLNSVLVMMAEQGGMWDGAEPHGWHFHNTGYTMLVMRDLEKQEYVVLTGERTKSKRYVMASKGLDAAVKCGFDPSALDPDALREFPVTA